MSRAKPKIGRPARSGKAADERITIRATKAERADWERAAQGKPLSDWIREQVKQGAAFAAQWRGIVGGKP